MENKKEEIITKKQEREKRIKKEMLKMKKLYKNLTKEKMSKVQELIYRASFLLVMAQDMETDLIDCNSFTTTTINASQTFIKTNPLLKVYRDTIKSYQAVIKQLDDLTKDDLVSDPPKDELDEFIDS